MSERYVVVGLARVRAEWFSQMSSWSTTSALPVEFLKCVSANELHSRIDSGRAISAALLDATATGLDRDLIDHITSIGAAAIVLRDDRVDRDWLSLGATAVLDLPLTTGGVLSALRELSQPIEEVQERPTLISSAHGSEASPWQGNLVAVTGAGGSGTSCVAASIAQVLAGQPGNGGQVVLADLALNADQGMYHDSGDVIPGLQELVESHRSTQPSHAAILDTLHQVTDRDYALLLGLRRHRDWTALAPRSTDAALGSLRSLFRWTIADIDADLDGETETGSFDIEERNHVARHCVRSANVIVVTARPTLHGVHRLVECALELHSLGVDTDAVQPVFCAASRSRRLRAEICSSLTKLAGASLTRWPVFLPDRNLEPIHKTAARLPRQITSPLLAPLLDIAESSAPQRQGEPKRIIPSIDAPRESEQTERAS